jgi:phosphoribosylanthranilate isomerase
MNKIPKIKICGITDKKDALEVAKLKPDYLGFIFYSKSQRFVKPGLAKEIISNARKLPKNKILFVGVFVDQSIKEVKQIIKTCGLDVAQLHGRETPKYVVELKKICKKNCEVWKTIIIKSKEDMQKVRIYREVADKILFDRGLGSGKTVDLSVIRRETIDILAGGLGVGNIKSILNRVSPGIVDANSKLELSPGRKEISSVKEFIKKARQIK